MNIVIPEYIEGDLKGQYRGNFESSGYFKRDNLQEGTKYSVDLYKDFRILNATIIDKALYDSSKENDGWWRIDFTAEAAIEFVQPFFENFSFLRHKPLEIYVQLPQLAFPDKREGQQKTFGLLDGKIRAKLALPPPVIKVKTEKLPIVTPEIEKHTISAPPADEACCFRQNATTTFWGLNNGASGTGGCYGLTGGPLRSRGLFGAYGNPGGCFGGSSSQGCFPNLGLGCLMPFLLFFFLMGALLKSCEYGKSLAPVVNTIKKDRDDSRKPPPDWVQNPNDTAKILPDVTDDDLKPDAFPIIDDSTQQNQNGDKRPTLKKGELLIQVWDWDREDKDSVAIYFNNRLVVNNYKATKKPYIVKLKGLHYGENYLEVQALNSRKGSNTVGIKGFSDRNVLCDTMLLQKASQTTRLTLIYQ
jgi:hypothetical protein